MQVLQNSVGASFDHALLHDKNFKGFNFQNAKFFGSDLSRSNFENANAQFATFIKANLTGANLANAKLRFASFREACLVDADLRGADLTDSDLTGANLNGARLNGAIGLGTRQGEIKFARRLLKIFHSGKGELEMSDWHTCETSHCIAGWAFSEENPGPKASRLYPTLAQCFLLPNEEAMRTLRLVAAGKLSVFPD